MVYEILEDIGVPFGAAVGSLVLGLLGLYTTKRTFDRSRGNIPATAQGAQPTNSMGLAVRKQNPGWYAGLAATIALLTAGGALSYDLAANTYC